LRWHYQAKRYTLNLFLYIKTNLLKAKKIAVVIEIDMVAGVFDETLDQYRIGNLSNNPTMNALTEKSIVSLFEQWALEYKKPGLRKTQELPYHSAYDVAMGAL
jgi:hypothetical protein